MPGSTTIIDWLGSGNAADIPLAATIDALIAPGTFAFYYSSDTGDLYALDRTGPTWVVVATAGGSGITELAGDVTAGPGSGPQTAVITDDAVTTTKIIDDAITTAKIIDSAVTNAKLADMPTGTIKANVTGGSAPPDDAAPADVAALLEPFLPGNRFVLPLAKTADYGITAADTGTTFTTVGAGADVTGSLPAADTPGIQFRCAVSTTDYHGFAAAGTDVFIWGGNTGAAGGYMRSNVLGSVLRAECHEAGKWVALAESGEWGMDE